jgi:hypothetical protein
MIKAVFFAFVLFLLAWHNSLAQLSKFNRDYPHYSKVRNSKEQHDLLNDSTMLLGSISNNPDYGWSADFPVMLGLAHMVDSAALYREKYLNALLGPQGERVLYERLAPCCPFRTPNQLRLHLKARLHDNEFGLLERYRVWINTAEPARILYVNIYDEGDVIAPLGFTFKQAFSD